MENFDKDNANMKEIIKDLQKKLKDITEVYDLLKENRELLQQKNHDLLEKVKLQKHFLECAETRREEAIKQYSEFVLESYHSCNYN